MPGYTAVSLADLQARLQTFYESVPFWTPSEATTALNDSLRMWNLLTGRWKVRAGFPTAPNQLTYVLPSAFVFRTRVTWNGQPLSPSSREDLNQGRPNWRYESTATGGDVPVRPMLWAPRSLLTFDIWPVDALGHNSLTVDGVSATPTLVNLSDTVDLAEADLSALLGFALHTVSFKKGGVWFQSTYRYLRAFLQAAGEENARITTSAIYRRVMGQDLTRSLKPVQLAPSSIGDLAQAIAKQLGATGIGGGSNA